MIGSSKVIGLITARGGSKGVPRKNLRIVGGKPLIAWTIEAAKSASALDRLILSSDDTEIIDVAGRWGCEVPFVRPAGLATDASGSLEVVRHALSALDARYDYVVLLQPTSPLRTSEDIDACVQLCHANQASSCVTVCEVDKTPYWMFKLDPSQRLMPLFPAQEIPQNRQAAPKIYGLNGAVFVARTDHIMSGGSFVAADTVACLMPRERSMDIDAEEDLALLELRVFSRHG